MRGGRNRRRRVRGNSDRNGGANGVMGVFAAGSPATVVRNPAVKHFHSTDMRMNSPSPHAEPRTDDGHMQEMSAEKPRFDSAPSSRSPFVAVVNALRCAGCGACVSACSKNAISLGSTARIDAQLCTGCGDCVEQCVRNAISLQKR